jgi:hypothetical protein
MSDHWPPLWLSLDSMTHEDPVVLCHTAVTNPKESTANLGAFESLVDDATETSTGSDQVPPRCRVLD